jgi:uncharacterized protein (TIGR02001 family)
MLKTTKTLMAASIVLGASACFMATPVLAQGASSVSLSANLSLVSDYRFRGISLSDEDPAIQGGIDASLGGFYVGTWASSIEQVGNAETEIDLYGGYGGDITDGLSYDVGFLYYTYPEGNGSNYYEVYGSLSGSVQLFNWTVGTAYAPDQNHLDFSQDGGSDDNLYVYGDGHVNIPDSPFYVGAHVGWEDGAFADNKIDWSGKLGVTYQMWDISVSYVDSDAGDAGVVFGVGAAF